MIVLRNDVYEWNASSTEMNDHFYHEFAIEKSGTYRANFTLLITSNDGGNESRVSYGISAHSNVNENGTATIVASVHDITSDRENLSKLVDDCNRLELSTEHLSDVVEAFLSD